MLGERRMVEYPANSRHICRSLFVMRTSREKPQGIPPALFSPNYAKATYEGGSKCG